MQHRFSALAQLRTLLEGAPHDDYMTALLRCLQSAEFRSFVLPENGLYLSETTPAHVTLTDELLPFPQLVLEYAAPDLLSYKDGVKTKALLFIVDMLYRPGEVFIWAMSQSKIEGSPYVWVPCTLGIVQSGGIEITVDAQGNVSTHQEITFYSSGIQLDGNSDDSPARHLVFYRSLLGRLAHFSMIWNTHNVIHSRVQYPARASQLKQGIPPVYYRLTCTGSTPFEWLPTSKMRTLN